MLNRFLGMQAEVVDLFEGSVDKFVGDEMVALFTAKMA
jgi:class 3 adenylate cyclase